MDVPITPEILAALGRLGHVPENLQRRFDAVVTSEEGAYTLRLSDDDAMALAELVQWHVKTDPATGRPTAETAPYADLIGRIDEAQF
jgi:hypothetical protein